MRLVKFKLFSLDRIVYINPDHVESVGRTYTWNSHTGKEDTIENQCFIAIVGQVETSYYVEGSLDEVIAKLIGD